ncbi:hypothetical protein [Nocardia africana]|uniref:Uncharacterized protein n=1 Tax=Nocardia africana TaxID=134964 RepID=A0ABW6NEX8_9NOCA
MKTIVQATATSVLVAAAVAAATATASASGPGAGSSASPSDSVSVQLLPGVEYAADVASQSTRLTTPFGTLTTDAGRLQVRDLQGDSIWGDSAATSISAEVGTVFPTAQAVAAKPGSGTTPTEVEAPAAALVDGGEPHDSSADIEAALGVVSMNFGLASSVGAMVGGVGGMVVGCPIGAVTGGLVAVPTTLATMTLPAAAFGCLIGAGTFGGLGAIIGGAVIGAPVGIATAIQQYNILHAQGDL